MPHEKKATKPAPLSSSNINELLFKNFATNDFSVTEFLSFLSPLDLAKAARTSQFFLAGAKADAGLRWKSLVQERYAAHPVLKKKRDEKTGKDRLETYKEMYQRLDALYVEIRKELMLPPLRPMEQKKVGPKRREARLALFFKVVANGLDRFEEYFPQLRPDDINVEFNDYSPLREAAVKGQTEFVRRILEWRARVDDRGLGYFDGGGGYGIHSPGLGNTALVLAATHGHLGCLRQLIENPDETNRAQVSAITPDFHSTALHEAADRGHVDCVRYLLEQGARTDVFHKYKERPLDCAANDACKDLIRAKMIERGESVAESSFCVIS